MQRGSDNSEDLPAWTRQPTFGELLSNPDYLSSSHPYLSPDILSPSVELDLPFKFLDLPIELRYLIYKLIFVGRTTTYRSHRIETCERVADSFRRPANPDHPFLSYQYFNLLQTCRQVNREASDVLYSQNTFVFRMAPTSIGDFPWSYRFLKSIGADNCWLLRHVKLCIYTAHSPAILKDPAGYWQVTLATLWARCRLKTLTVKLYLHNSHFDSYHLEFRYNLQSHHGKNSLPTFFDDSTQASMLAETDSPRDWRGLEQVKLELSASVRAFEMCHGLG